MSMKRTVTSGSEWVVSLMDGVRERERGVEEREFRLLIISSWIGKLGVVVGPCKNGGVYIIADCASSFSDHLDWGELNWCVGRQFTMCLDSLAIDKTP